MPDTFEINQGARFMFSIVSFPFLTLFRLSVALVKPVLGAGSFSSLLCLSRLLSEKCRARIARERRSPTRSTHSIPGFVSLRSHFTFPKSGLG
jgi:hypothetical protein